MSDRMTDERLAKLGTALVRTRESTGLAWLTDAQELHAALVAERGRVVRLEAALTNLIDAHGMIFPSQPTIVAALKRAAAVLAEGATE